MSTDKYIVTGPDGKIITSLNPQLAAHQNVSDEQLEALKLSHQLRWMIFEAAKKVIEEPLKLKMLANIFDLLETEQQKLWNFKLNQNIHRFFDFPGCKCPKIDNADRLGTPYRVYSEECTIHGERND
jgi:hypothetical protein